MSSESRDYNQFRLWLLCLTALLCSGLGGLGPPNVSAQGVSPSDITRPYLAKAKVYLQAGDYRRAVETCQRIIDLNPTVEAYVYLAYVYEALDGYLAFLVKKEDYVKVEQLSLNLTAREVIDLIDPPNVLPRMAQELIHEGIRQQFDITAAMANRIDKMRTDELWVQQRTWREAHPDTWWSGVPPVWAW